jgi:hypothetical protein
MATLSTVVERTLPEPGTTYPDAIDENYFNFLKEHINTLEANNSRDVQERISNGSLKKLLIVGGIYTEGVPIEYVNLVLEAITELADDKGELNGMFWLIQQSSARVYLQPRNRISSDQQHIGNIWIFDEHGYLQLFMVKKQ